MPRMDLVATMLLYILRKYYILPNESHDMLTPIPGRTRNIEQFLVRINKKREKYLFPPKQ